MVNKLRGLAILAVMATAGSLGVAAPASADPTKGTIAGHFTDGGTPMAGVLVFVTRTDGSAFSYSTTDSSGFYRTSELPPGDYKVEFDLRWGKQYAHQKLGWDTATIYSITAANEIVVDDTLLPTGSISGRFTAQDGSGIGGVSVYGIGSQPITTDANGDWQAPKAFARPGYTIFFSSWERRISQYAFGKKDSFTADPITVTAGVNTVVNDTLLPTGSVRVTARDSVTGAPISTFSANAGNSYGNTQTGEIILADVTVGTQTVYVGAEGYLRATPVTVTVVQGQQVDVVVTVSPPSVIEATVVDRATGAPLAGVCVGVVRGELRPTEGTCWNHTDEQGKISIGDLESGTYNLVAFPMEAPGYGTQWVGANGGTGKQHLAADITVGVGQTAAAPLIKMDRAGSITGRVTKPSGAPASSGWTAIYGVADGAGEIPPGAAIFDADGRYRLDNLGPYDWQLFFFGDGEARQYSGGVANRLLARAIPVSVGATSTYNFQLRAGTAMTFTITGITQPNVTLVFFNAVTGDKIDYRQVYPQPFTVTTPLIGPQFVKIAVETFYGRVWVGGADQAHAGIFWIPGSGSKTIQINL